MNTLPPLPEGDYMLYHNGRFMSYGPRVDRDGNVRPPEPGETPEFWGVYVWDWQNSPGWLWYADVSMRALAHQAAEAALAAVLQ